MGAVIERSAYQQALGSLLEEESQQLALLASRTEEAAQTVTSPPLLLSEARLNEVELAALAAMYQSPSFGESVVRGCRDRAKKAPPVPDARSIEVLEAHLVDQPPEAPPRPAWLSPVCWHRALFAESALAFTVNGKKSYYKFVFATQPPLHATFCKVEVVEKYVSVEALSSANWDDVRSRNWAHTFAIDCVALWSWHQMPNVPPANIEVLPDLLFLSSMRVVSDCPPPSKAQAYSRGFEQQAQGLCWVGDQASVF